MPFYPSLGIAAGSLDAARGPCFELTKLPRKQPPKPRSRRHSLAQRVALGKVRKRTTSPVGATPARRGRKPADRGARPEQRRRTRWLSRGWLARVPVVTIIFFLFVALFSPGLKQPDGFCLFNGRNLAQGFQDILGNTAINMNDGDRLAWFGLLGTSVVGGLAAEGKIRDVDLVLAENRAHLADDAGNVAIAQEDQIAFQRRLDVDIVDRQQARVIAMQDGTLHAMFLCAGFQQDGEHAARATG